VNAYVTTGAAARELGISTATLTRWVGRRLVIPAEVTAGGHYRWNLDDLRAQIQRLRAEAHREPRRTLAEDIARVVHAANRELQIVQGDQWPSPPWDDAPDYQCREAVDGVQVVLDTPGLTPGEHHQAWVGRMSAGGWRYGEVKDEAAKTHPCMVPFGELPAEQQLKDRLFIAIVRALSPEETT
jgi:RyR domain